MFHSHAAAVQIPGSSHRVQLQLAFGSLFVSCRASWWLSCCWWEWSSPEKHLNVSDSQPVCARLWAHCGFLSKTNIVVLLFFCGYRSDLYTREEGTNDLMNRLTNPAVFNETPGHLQTFLWRQNQIFSDEMFWRDTGRCWEHVFSLQKTKTWSFLWLIGYFLCLTGSWAQRCDNIIVPETININT